jgi:hypothetical protein
LAMARPLSASDFGERVLRSIAVIVCSHGVHEIRIIQEMLQRRTNHQT